MVSFKDTVRAARLALDISQQTLAQRAGITQATVSRIEAGVVTAEPETINALADALELSAGVRVCAAFEPLAHQLGITVAQLLADAQTAQAELDANPDVDCVTSSLGVMVTRECTEECCAR